MTKKETIIDFIQWCDKHNKFPLQDMNETVDEYLKPKGRKKKQTEVTYVSKVLRQEQENEHNRFDILIDDAAWGSPVGSTICGLYSFEHKKFLHEVIDIKHFQSPNFENKTYLVSMANAALKMLTELKIDKKARILVCRGYVNNTIPILLSAHGYMNVSRGVIGEPLQTMIEDAARSYITSIGNNSYYDPKGMESFEIGRSFNSVVKWGVDNDKLILFKTGWSYFKEGKHLKLK